MPTIAAAIATVAAPGTPACSNAGANARPVAGPPVSVTDPFSTPNSGCMPIGSAIRTPTRSARPRAPWRAAGRAATCGPPTLSSDRLAPNPTVVKNAIMNGACSRVSNAASVHAARSGDEHRQRHQQPADHRRRHVVRASGGISPADAVPEEQHDAAERHCVDQIEVEHVTFGRSRILIQESLMANADASIPVCDTEFHRGLGLYDSTMVVVGSMIGSGIFIVSADMARTDRQPGLAARRLAADRTAHRRRRALLRRAGGDDAARRRAVRLPARGVLAAVGLPLRLDAVSGHPDRHDRRRVGRLRALLRRAGAVDRRRQLPDRADPPLDRLRAVAVDDAAGRHPDDRAADLDQHARPRVRQDHPERLHHREDRRAARPDPGRRCCSAGTRPRSATTSATSGRARGTVEIVPGLSAVSRVRAVRRDLRVADRIAVLGRRLEQHHVHRRRGEGSAAQHPALARARHLHRHRPVPAGQRRLPGDAALRSDSARAGRPRRHRDAERDLSRASA